MQALLWEHTLRSRIVGSEGRRVLRSRTNSHSDSFQSGRVINTYILSIIIFFINYTWFSLLWLKYVHMIFLEFIEVIWSLWSFFYY